LEEAPLLISRSSEVERPSHVFTLSAKSESALKALAHRYTTWLTDHPEAPLADVCFSANAGRSHFEYRLAVVADSTEQLHQQLKAFTAGAAVAEVCVSRVISKRSPKIAFLFTGQGSQYVEMGRQLYETQPTFRGALDQCAEILQTHMGMSLLDILYLDRNCDRVDEVVQSMPPGQASKQASKIDQTAYAQPALFAVEYALARLWQSWGIQPTMVMGHSLGEYVAACIAGVFSLEDGLKLVAHRAKLMQALPEIGKMASVFADEATVRAAIAPYPAQVSIAAFNGPQNIVLSGETTAVNQVIDQLAGQGVKARRLQVSHAFHSPLMEPMLAEFGRVASEIVYRAPSIEIISNLTGQGATADIATPQYWVDHVRQPVQFTSSIEFLSQKKCQIFLEIGAKPTLSKLGQTVGGHAKSALWLSCLRPGREDWPQLLESLRALYARGVAVDWAGFDRDYPRRRMTLPTYPFQRQRYWFESTESEFEELIPVFSESHNEGDSFVRLEEVQTVLQFLRSQKRLSKQEPSTGFSSIPGQDG
jgi:acyl transferase domain-containing protein